MLPNRFISIRKFHVVDNRTRVVKIEMTFLLAWLSSSRFNTPFNAMVSDFKIIKYNSDHEIFITKYDVSLLNFFFARLWG